MGIIQGSLASQEYHIMSFMTSRLRFIIGIVMFVTYLFSLSHMKFFILVDSQFPICRKIIERQEDSYHMIHALERKDQPYMPLSFNNFHRLVVLLQCSRFYLQENSHSHLVIDYMNVLTRARENWEAFPLFIRPSPYCISTPKHS